MNIDIYSSFFIQMILFILISVVLLVSVISLFIKPAKRTIRASLVDASNGHIIDISQAETSIGRAKTCDIALTNGTVSRFHAVLSRRASGWIIFDTHSTSGTYVNGQTVEKKQYIKDGDYLSFGTAEYVFYSTAVTTRQQIIIKQQNQSKDQTKRKNNSGNGVRKKQQQPQVRSKKAVKPRSEHFGNNQK